MSAGSGDEPVRACCGPLPPGPGAGDQPGVEVLRVTWWAWVRGEVVGGGREGARGGQLLPSWPATTTGLLQHSKPALDAQPVFFLECSACCL
jgi:hypothetical protein